MATVLEKPVLDWLCWKMIEGISQRIRALPIKQLIRFGIVGVISNMAGYLIYLLITSAGIDPKITVSILFPIGTVLNFVGNKKWTFGSSGSNLHTGFRHILVFALGYVLNILILLVFVDYLGFAHQLVQFVAIFVVALYIFVAIKFFVFADKS